MQSDFRYPSSVFCHLSSVIRNLYSIAGSVGMKQSPSNLVIQRFVSATGKNQYLLTSAGEAAVIDVSESYDEICKLLDTMGIELKYLFVTHAHKRHLQVLPELKKKYGGNFCLHEYE